MLTACSVENARVRKQAEELLMKALATIDISCRLDPTVREFGSPCGKIAPNPEILILHHEFCDTWNKQELGAKPGICSKLMPLEGGKAKPRGKNSSIIGI